MTNENNYGIQILEEKRNSLLSELDDLKKDDNRTCKEKRMLSIAIQEIDDVISTFQEETFRRTLDRITTAINDSRVSIYEAIQAIEQFKIPNINTKS